MITKQKGNMIENLPHLVKHTSPTRYDGAPYATAWVLNGDKDSDLENWHKDRLWIQTSMDVDKPDWQEMPNLLCNVFEQFYGNPHFLEECLLVLREKKNKKNSDVKEIKFVR